MQISDLSGRELSDQQKAEMDATVGGFVKVFVQKEGKTKALFLNVIESIETGEVVPVGYVPATSGAANEEVEEKLAEQRAFIANFVV
jgi:hypothetical protein